MKILIMKAIKTISPPLKAGETSASRHKEFLIDGPQSYCTVQVVQGNLFDHGEKTANFIKQDKKHTHELKCFYKPPCFQTASQTVPG